MADLQPTDEFLVNRDDTTYTQQQDTLMANLETTDYLLVNRSDATFKITGEDLINSVIDPLEIDAVLINPNLNIGETAAVQVSLLGGKAPFSYVYQWKSTDADDNKTDIADANASTYVVQEEDLGNRLSCEVTVTDSLDSEDTDETDLSNPVTAVEAVTKPTLIAPPDGAGLSDLTREGVFPESGAIQSVTQEGFSAVMDGLRFDENRATFLSTTLGQASTAGTVSVWIKVTDYGSYGYIWKTSNDLGLYIDTSSGTYNGKLAISASHYASGSPGTAYSTDTIPLNEWVNVVFRTGDGTNTAGMWINGVSQDNSTIDWTTGGFAITDGFTRIGEDNGGNYFNGYMSDFYLVDGQSLEPTDFGTADDGVWGPLDRSVILANIQAGEPSPYDQRPNMDEEWSAGTITGDTSYVGAVSGPSNAFDGDLGTTWLPTTDGSNPGGEQTLTFTNPITCTKCEIYAYRSSDSRILKVNGKDTSSLFPSNSEKEWHDVSSLLTDGKLISLTTDYPGGSSSAISAVRCDSRIVVDGPANNSAVWSDALTVNNMNGSPASWFPSQEPIRAFDSATPDNNGAVIDGFSGVITFAPGTPVPITDAFKWWAFSYSANSNLTDAYLELDGIRVNIGGLPGNAWVDVPEFVGKTISTGTPLTSTLISESAEQRAYLGGIMVDGEVLVDGGGDQWNTSEVWSKTRTTATATPESTGPLSKAFDGNPTTYCQVGGLGDNITVDLTGFSGEPSVVINKDSSTPMTAVFNFADGTNVTKRGDTASGDNIGTYFKRVFAGKSGVLSNVVITRTDEYINLGEVAIDGKILVDTASFGANGFYLPFDPAATGQIWSSQLSDGATFVKNYGPEKAFNGLTVTDGGRAVPSTASVIFNFGGIPITTGLSISVGSDGSGVGTSATFKVNGVDVKSQVSAWQKAHTEFTAITGFTQLDTIEIGKDSDAAYTSLYGVKVDGKLLIDHNNIGVDDSGNDNHFHDENFVVGNTSQVWSSSVTTDSGTFGGGTPADSFDGTESTGCWAATQGALSQYIVTFNTGLTGNLEVTSFSGNTVTVNGIRLGTNTVEPTDIGIGTYSVNNMTSLMLTVNDEGNTYSRPGIRRLKLDGVLLIDANIQDTVKDTPMTNYAVLEEGTNGNLHYSNKDATTKSFSTLQFNNTTESGHYWEVTVTGTGTACIGFSPTKFTGDGVAADSGYNFDQEGYLNATRTNGTPLPDTNPAFTPQAIVTPAALGDVFSMAVKGNNWSYWHNGVLVFDGDVITQSGDFYIWLGAGGIEGAAWAINCGQQPFAYAADNGDSTVTIDGVVYGTLFEELTSTATLTLADEGTLGLIPDGATPRMNATGNGAEGSYKSHTSTELVMNNIVGSWTTDSLTAKSVTEYSPAAPNPDDFTMVSSAYDATPEETALHGSTIWQVSDDPGFSAPVINEDTDVYLESFDTGGLQPETIYYGRVKHITVNGTSSPWSDVNTFKTATGEDPDPETANMSGLRFDNNRATKLTTTLSGSGSQVWTFSTWFKQTDHTMGNNFPALIVAGTTQSSYDYIYFNAETGQAGLVGSSGDIRKDFSGTFTNKWTNVVVSVDGTKVDISVNGVTQSTASTADWVINDADQHDIGFGTDVYIDGYLSEVYFADGQALEPTAFGKDIDGRWAPLGNSTIINNITRSESPYDQRPNTDQTWSDGCSNTGAIASPSTNAFDGVETTYWNTETGYPSGITFNPPLPAGTITLKCDPNDGAIYQINGVDVETIVSGGEMVITKTSSDPISSIGFTGDGIAGSAWYYYVIHNNRMLVDNGLWDISQNWSVGTLTGQAQSPSAAPAAAFDGNLSTNFLAKESQGEATFTLSNPVTVNSKLEVYVRVYDAGGVREPAFKVNGNDYKNTVTYDQYDFAWFEIPETTLESFTSYHAGQTYTNIAAWRVDDKILVDPGAQWNTSQVWSDAATGDWNPSYGKENVFDGSLATEGGAILGTGNTPDAITTVVMPFTGFSSISSLRLHASLSGQNSHGVQDGRIIINGVDITAGGLSSIWAQNGGHNDHRWVTIPVADIGNKLENITLTSTDVVAPYFKAIEVDGQILVDGVDGFGANGFYLPFDPEAVGGDSYANRTVATNTKPGRGPENIYNAQKEGDGKEDDTCNILSGGGYIKLSNVNFENVSKFEFTESHNGTVTVTFNDDSSTTQTVTSPTGQTNIDTEVSAPATITSIEFNTGDSFWLSWIKINGEMLIDYNNIGVDDSGKENHFHDKNFAVGNTSQIWSQALSPQGPFKDNAPPSNGFDGSEDTQVALDATGSTLTFNPNLGAGPFDVIYRGFNQGMTTVTIDGTTLPYKGGSSGIWEGTVNTFNSMIMAAADGNRPGITWISVNGVMLIDANIQDTVKDTPMTNYAVLDSGTNGNLVGSGTLTYTGEVGNTYYYETDDVGITAEAPVSNVGTGTHNFGQQPFAGSNVTDNGDGTVTIGGVVYSTLFEDFRESAGGFGYFYDAVNEKPVRGTTIADKYGLFRAEPRLGIHDLTEVPNYQVAGYERRGNQYQPIRSLAPELKASQAETAAAQAETVAAEAQADQYLNYLRAAACMWVVDKVYEAGDIINFNGQLYRATINAVATANTDPGDGTDRWEALNITAN